ncbi:MAG: hypothetical protein RL297_1265 [Pseudomonadota bacterium]|jgi:uncharacterized membrane protein
MRWARWWRHRWLPDNAARRAVPDDMAERLQQRIAQSEAQHSGEIVVCVEGALPNRYLARAGLDEPLDAVVRQRALAWFGKLRVWDTEHNNGVLIYLLLAERRIEVVADRGLSLCVPPDHWQAVIQPLGQALRSGEAEAGLMQAIQAVTTPLVTHFGLAPGASNANELGDRVVRV